MPLTPKHLLAILRREYGPPNWWPGDNPFEIAVGAILTQRTAWRNVEHSISSLKSRSLLTPRAIAAAGIKKVEKAIRPSGFYRQKASSLMAFSKHLVESYDGDMRGMRFRPIVDLRNELLELPGIGPETADSILLYALDMPSFVVDAYTVRLLRRLRLPLGSSYGEIKAGFERALGEVISDYSDMHALIVMHCKQRCKTVPKCTSCPLAKECPSNS